VGKKFWKEHLPVELLDFGKSIVEPGGHIRLEGEFGLSLGVDKEEAFFEIEDIHSAVDLVVVVDGNGVVGMFVERGFVLEIAGFVD
jgi:hypothetical protein